MTIKEVGLSDSALDLLAQCLCRKSSEIKVELQPQVTSELVMLVNLFALFTLNLLSEKKNWS